MTTNITKAPHMKLVCIMQTHDNNPHPNAVWLNEKQLGLALKILQDEKQKKEQQHD